MRRWCASLGLVLAVLVVGSAAAGATGTGPVSMSATRTTLGSTDSLLSISTASDFGIPSGMGSFVGCRYGLAYASWTQTAARTGEIRHVDNGAGDVSGFTTTLHIPPGGLSFALWGCTFTMSGDLLGQVVLAAPVAHGAVARVFGTSIPATGGVVLLLTVANVAGNCGTLGIASNRLFTSTGEVIGNYIFGGLGLYVTGI